MRIGESFQQLCAEMGAFVLGAQCAGCGQPGTFLCVDCHASLAMSVSRVTTSGGLTVYSAHVFDDAVARMLRQVKERGMTSAARPLGGLLAELLSAIPHEQEISLVPVPTTSRAFRRRGYRVPDLLIKRAGYQAVPALRYTRTIADQRGLGRGARAANIAHAMSATRRATTLGTVILIDDVCTTGATLDEAARALREVGADVKFAATVALTRRANDTT